MRSYNPLAPMRPKALRRQVTHDILAQLAPLAAQINARTAAGGANISGIARALAASYAPFAKQESDIYSGAQQREGAIDSALADRLGMGSPDALRQRLAAAGQDTGLADKLGATVHGASGAGFARGSAEQGQLNTLSALGGEYASKLPGLARLAGLQDVNQRQAQGQQQLSDLQSKAPGLIATTLADARNRELQKALANQSGLISGQKLGAQIAYQQGTLSLRQQAIKAANKRSALTLAERAKQNGVSNAQQARRDQLEAQRLRQQRRQQWYREHQGNKKKPKSGSGGPY